MSGSLRLLIPFGVGILSGSKSAFCEGSDSSDDGGEGKKKCKKRSDETELEQCIANCRKNMVPIKNSFIEYSEQAGKFAKDASKTVMRNVDYLQNCAPPEVKAGAIIGSGLFGMLLSFRRGMIRRLFFGTVAGTAAAAIIYPCEAKLVAGAGYALAKKYTLMAYKAINDKANGGQKKECKKKKAAAECDCPKDK